MGLLRDFCLLHRSKRGDMITRAELGCPHAPWGSPRAAVPQHPPVARNPRGLHRAAGSPCLDHQPERRILFPRGVGAEIFSLFPRRLPDVPQAGEPGEGEQEEGADGGSGARAAIGGIWGGGRLRQPVPWRCGGCEQCSSPLFAPQNRSGKRCFLTISAGKALVKFLG